MMTHRWVGSPYVGHCSPGIITHRMEDVASVDSWIPFKDEIHSFPPWTLCHTPWTLAFLWWWFHTLRFDDDGAWWPLGVPLMMWHGHRWGDAPPNMIAPWDTLLSTLDVVPYTLDVGLPLMMMSHFRIWQWWGLMANWGTIDDVTWP